MENAGVGPRSVKSSQGSAGPGLAEAYVVWALVGISYLSISYIHHSLTALWASFLITGPLEVLCFWLGWRAWLRANP